MSLRKVSELPVRKENKKNKNTKLQGVGEKDHIVHYAPKWESKYKMNVKSAIQEVIPVWK